jgi:O-antigen/teichoic acid export membrane protein
MHLEAVSPPTRAGAFFASVLSARSAPWALVSTSVSSLGSFALSLAVLRSGSTATFGYFGLVFAYYTFALNLIRAITGSPIILLFSGRDSYMQRAATSAAVVNSIALGGLFTLAALLLIPVFASEHQDVLFAGVVFLPGVLAQDTIRYAYFARRQPRGSAIADIIWTTLQLALFLALATFGTSSPSRLLLAWGLAGSIAAALMAVGLRIEPDVRRALRALRTQRATSAPLTVEMGALGAVDLLVGTVVAALGGAAILGSYRAGALLVAPFNVFLASVILTIVPAAVSHRATGVGLNRLLLRAAIALVSAALGIGALVALLPGSVATAIFGDKWATMNELLPFWIFAITAMGVSSVAFAGLRILRRLRLAMAIRLLLLPVTVSLVAAGVHLDGARGAVLGYGVGVSIGGLVALVALTRLNRERPA